jgi:hypothetical protein
VIVEVVDAMLVVGSAEMGRCTQEHGNILGGVMSAAPTGGLERTRNVDSLEETQVSEVDLEYKRDEWE